MALKIAAQIHSSPRCFLASEGKTFTGPRKIYPMENEYEE